MEIILEISASEATETGLIPGRSGLASKFGTNTFCWTSLGMSMTTGPGLPLFAIKNASLIIRGKSSALRTR